MGNTVSDYLFGGNDNEQRDSQQERDRRNITSKRRLDEGAEASPPDRKKCRTGTSAASAAATTPLTGSSPIYDEYDQFADAAESEDEFVDEKLGSGHQWHRHQRSDDNDDGMDDDRKLPASSMGSMGSESCRKHRSKKHKKKKKKKHKHKEQRSTLTAEASLNSFREISNGYAESSQRDSAMEAVITKDAKDPNLDANSRAPTVVSTRGPPAAELPRDRQLSVDKRSKVKRPRSSFSYYMEDNFAHVSERYPDFTNEEVVRRVNDFPKRKSILFFGLGVCSWSAKSTHNYNHLLLLLLL